VQGAGKNWALHQIISAPNPRCLSFFQFPQKHDTMRQLRIQSLWWLLTLVSHGFAITLLEVIATYPQLSTLNTYVNVTSNVTSLLTSANNFTFLAASNTAISSFISNNPNVLTNDLLQATLQYSLLKGGYPTLSFSNASQFVQTNLVNASYANVTGGQVSVLLYL
jgi:hypothetical protein